jgi:hypothetical protein
VTTSPSLAEPGVFESYGAHTLPSATTPVGPTVNGFALSLTADSPTATLGSPIWVTVELRPISDRGSRVLYGSRHSAYTFAVTRQSDGSTAPHVPNGFGLATISGPPCGRGVSPGTSIFGRFDLNQTYAITKPGTYTVTAVGKPIIECAETAIRSTAITITVK